MTYYLAIDIGASSGRHMLGHRADGKLVLEEVYRFPNGMIKRDGQLVWDVDALLAHILEGMRRCGELGKIPKSVGIDTWSVDFVLLDKTGTRLGPAVCYRNGRTKGADALVEQKISFTALYNKTGIQKQIFNTIYQLAALQRDVPELLDTAKTFLMLPDYFHYRLTGKMASEYTNATSTALVGATSKTWDRELIQRLGLPQTLFTNLIMPGTVVGSLTAEIAKQVGYSCDVTLPATHDTASAFMAAPVQENDAIYLSSGTWSLIGIESPVPIVTDYARQKNFTNEGGYAYRFRFLKNIMGLWMLQEVRRETGEQYSFAALAQMAKESGAPAAIVDVNDQAFLAPDSMIAAVKQVARQLGQAEPDSLGQVIQCIYYSLAKSYADTVAQLEEATGRKFTTLHILGGGSQDSYLNTLTAKATGLTVYAGPVEGTATGNLMVQMMAAGEINSLEDGRQMIRDSFPITKIQGDILDGTICRDKKAI